MEFRSGAAIAAALGMSRATVHGLMQQAQALGVAIQAVRGRGYRLATPLDLLDARRLATALQPRGFHVHCLASVDSSNTRLLQRVAAGAPHKTVLAAEWQAHGRGRRGRVWEAGLGDGLAFSLLWRFQRPVAMLSGLSLAVGVALARCLARLGLDGIGLKWPNDLLVADRKLAGILIELVGDMLSPAAAVIGIGLNVRGAERLGQLLETPVSDLESTLERRVERGELLLQLLAELDEVLTGFDRQGFAAYREEWHAWHAWQDQPVRVAQADGDSLRGLARGVDEQGALLLETTAGLGRLLSGEVSLRREVGT